MQYFDRADAVALIKSGGYCYTSLTAIAGAGLTRLMNAELILIVTMFLRVLNQQYRILSLAKLD